MTACRRVGAGLVLLLTMLVSPVVSVLCGLSCREAAAMSHAVPASQRQPAAEPSPSPCHETSAARSADQVAAVSAVFGNAAWHECDHASALTSASVSGGPRVAHPVPSTSASAYVSAQLTNAAAVRLPVRLPTPTPQRAATLSVVLRI